MEHKQFTSDDLSDSPYSHQGFQTDRFTKTTTNLNIPDTIIENYSAELIGELSKMEVPKITIETYDSDENKENVSYNQQVTNNEPSNSSENLAIDSLYIKHCEKKLLESSFSDEEKNFQLDNKGSVGSVSRHVLEIQSNSAHHNDTISTPPSLLRKEISMLRKEMAEADEFHDFEIKVLQEERFQDGVDPEKYIELFEKYSALVELYTNLKTELDEYRKNQESVRNELQSKTADYLESLCSQIETSDNSLNFSSSFVSFSGGVKNSTMMEEVSEVQATVVHDGTVLANDPLSITVDNGDGTFKTPLQTPLRSAKKLFPEELSSSAGKTALGMKDILAKRDLTFESEYNIQLLNLETAFYDKVKEVEDLEQRLFKVEDMSIVLHSEFERITSVYAKNTTALREELSVKTEQLNDLMQKLFTETISLNPSLKDSLVDIPGTKLLGIFFETIMENCKKIKNDDQLTTTENLRNQLSSQEIEQTELEMLRTTCEDLKAKLADASSTISTREEEIKMLQSHVTNVRQTREDLASANESLLELDSKLKKIEAEKTAAENKCKDLEKVGESLSLKFGETQIQLALAQEEKSQIENENARLKESHESLKVQITETEAILKSQEIEIVAVKENLMTAELSVKQLLSQLKSVEDEKTELLKFCEELQEKNVGLQGEIEAVKNPENNPALQNVQTENHYLKQQILELEKCLAEHKIELENARKREVEELKREVEEVKQENSEFSKALENMERNQKLLADLLSDLGSDSDLPCDRITNLIQKVPLQDSLDARETKIMSGIVETITKTCKNVQNELIRNFEDQKSEWEDQRNLDLKLIKSLEDDVKLLGEKRDEGEAKLKEIVVEKEDFMKVHEDLKNRIMEAERMVSSCHEEIKSLKSQEEVFKKAKDDLSEAEEVIARLSDQLLGVKAEKTTVENKCRDLETVWESLSLKFEESQTQLALAQEEKSQIENENARLKESHESLKVQITETEAILKSRESEIVAVKENLMTAESSVQHLQSQLKLVEDEKAELHKVCEELQEKNEGLQGEIAAAKTPENNPAFEKVQTENDYLKQQILGSEKRLAELKIELENVKKSEVEELMREVERVKKENSGFSKSLVNVERGQKFLAELLSEPGNNSEWPCERITKLIENASALKESLDPRETKIMSGFVETITKTCKNVQNELIRNFEDQKSEWEDQRNLDLKLIKSLEDDVKLLKEKRDEGEAKMKEIISEKEGLMKVHEDLKNQITEAERMVSSCNEEIKSLKSQEEVFKKAKDDLSEAEKVIARLSDQLLGVKAEKTTVENKCRDLETVWESLSLKFEESQTQLALAQEEKSQIENENARLKESHESLKVQITETEAILKSRESEIVAVKENLMTSESSVQQLQSQLKLVEDEKAELHKVCEELQEKNEGLQGEIAAAKNPENNPAFQKVQTENDYLKQQILGSEKRLAELKIELENVRKSEVEELVREMERVKKENSGFSKSLVNVERGQKLLAELLTDLKSDSDLPCDRIINLIQKVSLQDSLDARETIIMSGFVETITKICKTVQNELIRNFEGKKSEWIDQRNLDLKLIKSLEDDVKLLKEKKDEGETKLKEIVVEKDDLMKVHEDLKNQMMEAEKLLSSCNEEIKSLRSKEEVFKKAKDDLSEAEEVIARLSDQLLTVKGQKSETEQRCRELEDGALRTQMEGLKAENKSLKLGNDSLRDRVKQLTKIIEETAGSDLKDLSNTSTSLLNGVNLRSKSGKGVDRFARRLSKLEEINHNLTELLIRILTATEYPDPEKLKLSSVKDFPKTMKKVLDHINGFLSKVKELKEENSQLDEECETYSNIIKDLKKEAASVWKSNTEKTEALEAEIARLKAEKHSLENEKRDLSAKLSRLDDECQKLQSAPKTEGHHTGICGNESKRVTELKRIILMKEQKLLDLQDLEVQTGTLKSQVEYLKTALEREKRKAAEEKEKSKKLQNQLKEATKGEKKSEDNQVLEELRMRGSISGGIVQEFGDKEKMRKLSKDIGILKELCRARYAEIKRLEAVNAALRSATPKNSNQMDSPIRSRGYNTRSKYQVRDVWKTEIIGKENGGV